MFLKRVARDTSAFYRKSKPPAAPLRRFLRRADGSAKKSSGAVVLALLAVWPLLAESTPSETRTEKCRQAMQSVSFDIKTPSDFAKAMTEGMLLEPEQGDLFDFYIDNWFGHVSKEQGLDAVLEILREYPDISKLPVREQFIVFTAGKKEQTETLKRFLRSFQKSATVIRNNIFQVSQNWGFWARMLSFPKPDIEDRSVSARNKRANYKNDFFEYLKDLVGEKDFDFLTDNFKNTRNNHRETTKTLYKVLDKAKNRLEAEGRDTGRLAKAMADLIHVTGFGNPFYTEFLKSDDPLENIQGINLILTERDIIAFDLGFEGHFQGLKKALNTASPEDWSRRLNNIQEDIDRQPVIEKSVKTFRVRPLSLHEAPFRSCLSGDCASNSYFHKALDPDFLFFTLTDRSYKSSGHVAVVLGEAETVNGQTVKVAFVDKLQNVPKENIIPLLEAVRQSLKERGFRLGLPKDVGDENGLSNSDWIRKYVHYQILRGLEEGDWLNFRPRGGHSYPFHGLYSRADSRPAVLEFKGPPSGEELTLIPGKIFVPKTAPKDLSVKELYKPILLLRDSPRDEDRIQYVKQLVSMSRAKELELSENDVEDYLQSLMDDAHQTFILRKHAFFALIELDISRNRGDKDPLAFLDNRLNQFTPSERKTLVGEMSNWKNARAFYQREFIDSLNNIFFGDIAGMEAVENYSDLARSLLDINHVNQEDETALIAAVKRGTPEKMEFLLKSGADPDSQNKQGKTALMYLFEPEIMFDEEMSPSWIFEAGLESSGYSWAISVKREILLKYRARPDMQDEKGETILMKLARFESDENWIGDYEFETFLHRFGKQHFGLINLDRQDEKGETALMKAVAGHHLSRAKELVFFGANMNIQDKNGETACTKLIDPAGKNFPRNTEDAEFCLTEKLENYYKSMGEMY